MDLRDKGLLKLYIDMFLLRLRFTLNVIFYILLSINASKLKAQDGTKDTMKATVLGLADSIKLIFREKGLIPVFEGAETITKGMDKPIALLIGEKVFYTFIFISEPDAKSSELNVFGPDEKQIFYEYQQISERGNNIMYYGFTPEYPGLYNFFLAVNCRKRKQSLAAFILFKQEATLLKEK